MPDARHMIVDLPITRPDFRWFNDANFDFYEMTLEGLSDDDRKEVEAWFAERRLNDETARSLDSVEGARENYEHAEEIGLINTGEADAYVGWYLSHGGFGDPNGTFLGAFSLQLRERLAYWMPALYEEHKGSFLMVSPSYRFNGESTKLSSGRYFAAASMEALSLLEIIGPTLVTAMNAATESDIDLARNAIQAMAIVAAADAMKRRGIVMEFRKSVTELIDERVFGLRLGQMSGLFVVAHEFGHVALGHADGKPSSNAESQQQELDADLYALERMLGATTSDDFRRRFAIAALLPTYYWDLVDQLDPNPPQPSRTHPSWKERLTNLRENLPEERKGERLFMDTFFEEVKEYADLRGIVKEFEDGWREHQETLKDA